METVNREVLKRMAIELPTNVKALLRTGDLTVYDVLELLTGTMNTMVVTGDDNTEALEEWTHGVAEWAAEWENRLTKAILTASGNGGSDPVMFNSVNKIDGYMDGEVRVTMSDGSEVSGYVPFAKDAETDDVEENGGLMTKKESDELAAVVGLGIKIDTHNDVLTIGGKMYYLSDKKTEDVLVANVVYGAPKITLEYADKISMLGGSVSYSKFYCEQEVVTTYTDGSTKTTTNMTVDSVAFTGTNVSNTGVVTVGASTSGLERSFDVTVTVVMNGKTASKTVKVYQKASSLTPIGTNYYVGSINASASAFTALTDAQIVEGAVSSVSGSAYTYNSSKTCFYILVPDGVSVTTCKYSSNGLTTDVKGNNLWNLSHAKVTYNGKQYNVYGYRSGGINEDNQIMFEYAASAIVTGGESQGNVSGGGSYESSGSIQTPAGGYNGLNGITL